MTANPIPRLGIYPNYDPNVKNRPAVMSLAVEIYAHLKANDALVSDRLRRRYSAAI